MCSWNSLVFRQLWLWSHLQCGFDGFSCSEPTLYPSWTLERGLLTDHCKFGEIRPEDTCFLTSCTLSDCSLGLAELFGRDRVMAGFWVDGGFRVIASCTHWMLGSARFEIGRLLFVVGFSEDGGFGIMGPNGWLFGVDQTPTVESSNAVVSQSSSVIMVELLAIALSLW